MFEKMNVKRLHFTSGLIIAIFIFAHLTNHLFSILGANAHIEVMKAMRTVYRNLLVEILLLLAVLLQIISGLKLFFGERANAYTFFEKLHVWSGLYLAFFLIVHVGSVIIGRSVLYLDTNFYFGVAGLNTFPLNLFFIPYYTLAILSFFAHIAAVHNKKMKILIMGMAPKKQSYLILWIGLALTFFVLYGLTNNFKGVAIPSEYHILIEK